MSINPMSEKYALLLYSLRFQRMSVMASSKKQGFLYIYCAERFLPRMHKAVRKVIFSWTSR